MIVSRLLPVPKGAGIPLATAAGMRVSEAGAEPRLAADYIEREYLFAGLAGTYTGSVIGPATRADGVTDFVTRILVRRPLDVRRFSGRVVVEPFNTSNGPDTDALWSRVGPLLETNGDAWVGVSGRASAQRDLVKYDAGRYADIDLPSNDLAWDILAQMGALARDSERGPFRGLHVRHVYLAGYSQSGSDTATFAMAVHPHARLPGGGPIFDGYFPAGHSGSVTTLASGTARLPAFESVEMCSVNVPVVDVETQTDVEGFSARLSDGRTYTSPGGAHVRRSDSDRLGDRYRLYEVAGAPHSARMPDCEGGGSSFPASAFLRAGLAHLFRWSEDNVAPPSCPRIELARLDVVSAVRIDEYGNAVGGVRSPFVDVPLMRYDAHSGPGARCGLVGRETVLPEQVLLTQYGHLEAYLQEFSQNLDATIVAGFLLSQDRLGLLEEMTSKARGAFESVAG